MQWRTSLAVVLIALAHAGAQREERAAAVETRAWGQAADGTPVNLYTLRNGKGMTVRVTDYGATLVGIDVPDRDGKVNDVTLGFDDLAGYLKHASYGSTVGRVANRIARGRFTLEGKEYVLAVNNGPNHLHGGKRGFDKFVWNAEPIDGKDGPAVRFTRRSPDGEEGYPGNLDVAVTFTLTGDSAIRIDYAATTDKPAPVNLTNHTYFNLAGTDGQRIEPVLDHVATIHAERYTPFDATRVPTGEVAPVEGTALDFRKPTRIGERIAETPGERGGGYDHNFVVTGGGRGDLVPVATVVEPRSGRKLEVLSTEPGVQFFTANGFSGKTIGKRGLAYPKHAGFCLETQHFPDSVNRPDFPSVILRPGARFASTTVFRFSTVTAP